MRTLRHREIKWLAQGTQPVRVEPRFKPLMPEPSELLETRRAKKWSHRDYQRKMLCFPSIAPTQVLSYDAGCAP